MFSPTQNFIWVWVSVSDGFWFPICTGYGSVYKEILYCHIEIYYRDMKFVLLIEKYICFDGTK